MVDWSKIAAMLESAKLKLGDVDRDGDFDMADVAKLLKRLEAIAAVVVRVTPTGEDDVVFNGIIKPILDQIIEAMGG